MRQIIILTTILVLGLAYGVQGIGSTKIVTPKFMGADLSLPKSINFQGYLYRDENPIDTTMSMWFGIYDDPSAGSLLFQQTINNVTVTKGWFTVTLDNIPNSVFPVAGPTRYLEVKAPSTGPALTPRVSLVSVAYSYHSITADSAEYAKAAPLNRPITPPIFSAEIRDTTIITSKLKDGSVNSAKILDETVRGVDVAKPCTLSAGITPGQILYVSNTAGAVNSPAISAQAVGGPGLLVKSGRGAGVVVDSTGVNSSGFYARKTTRAGIEIDSATYYGFWLRRYAGSDGILLVKTGGDGIHIDTVAADGIYIGHAEDGLNFYRASDRAIFVDSARVGLDVAYGADGGVWITNTGATATAAVYGNSEPRSGGYFRNNNNDYYALTVWNNTGTGAAVKGIYVQGNGYATGGWSTFLADGKTGFSLTSSDMDIIVRGSASLTDGQASITFEKTMQEAFSNDVPLTIIVTPTSECNGMLVVNKSATGFTTKELLNGKSNATFDWIAIGRMNGYEKRIEVKPILTEIIQPTEQTDIKRLELEK